MGGSSPSMPQPANPAATAATQSQYNSQAAYDTARLNAVDQYTPFGSAVYTRDANGDPTAVTTQLNPTSSQTFNNQQQIGLTLSQLAQGRLAGAPAGSFNSSTDPGLNQAYNPLNQSTSGLPTYSASNLPYDPKTMNNIPAYIGNVQSAVYGLEKAPLDQRFGIQNQQTEQDIANRGLDPTGEAAKNLRAQAAMNQNTAYQQAANSSVAQSYAAAQQELGMEQGVNQAAFGQNLQDWQSGTQDFNNRFTTGNQIWQNQINTTLTNRNQDINEVSAILQGSPSIGMPSVPNQVATNVQAPNYEGDVSQGYNAAMQGYNAQLANSSANWNGVLGLGAAGLKFAMYQ